MKNQHRCKNNETDRVSIEYLEVKGRAAGGKTAVFKSWQMFVVDPSTGWRHGYKIIACPFCAKKLEEPKMEILN